MKRNMKNYKPLAENFHKKCMFNENNGLFPVDRDAKYAFYPVFSL